MAGCGHTLKDTLTISIYESEMRVPSFKCWTWKAFFFFQKNLGFRVIDYENR